MPEIDPSRLLLTVNPKLAAEWHPKKNTVLSLETVYAGSSKKVWWQCSTCGYEWEYSINHRVRGVGGCLSCNKRILTTSNPELAKEWSSKNLEPASAHKPGSRERVWWICGLGHEDYLASIANRRLLAVQCPKCRIAPFAKSVAGVAPHLVKEWSLKNNQPALATFARTSSKAIWECTVCSYEWETRVSYRVNNDTGCPQCNQRAISETNLAILFPSLAKEYSAKNPVKAEEIAAGSRKVCLWNCVNGHEYKMRPFERTRDKSSCPLCRLEKNSLAAKYPELAKEFNEAKNGNKTANDYMAGSPARVSWKCLESGHEWEVSISSRTGKKITGCPECVKTGTSKIEEIIRKDFIQDEIIEYIETTKANLAVRWRNRKSLEVDILGKYKSIPVVIEYDGWYWHTGQKKKDAKTPLERDLAKTTALLDAGYLVIRIREERSSIQKLPLLELIHPNLLQFHWNHLLSQDNTKSLRKTVYDWLRLQIT